MPHLVSSTRTTWTNDETYGGDTAVLTAEPCLIAPTAESPLFGTMGPAEREHGIIFIGADADIKMGDVLTEDTTEVKWAVVERPVMFENPRNFGTNDHQQAAVERLPIQ